MVVLLGFSFNLASCVKFLLANLDFIEEFFVKLGWEDSSSPSYGSDAQYFSQKFWGGGVGGGGLNLEGGRSESQGIPTVQNPENNSYPFGREQVCSLSAHLAWCSKCKVTLFALLVGVCCAVFG